MSLTMFQAGYPVAGKLRSCRQATRQRPPRQRLSTNRETVDVERKHVSFQLCGDQFVSSSLVGSAVWKTTPHMIKVDATDQNGG